MEALRTKEYESFSVVVEKFWRGPMPIEAVKTLFFEVEVKAHFILFEDTTLMRTHFGRRAACRIKITRI